jgi:hypothetical protein
MLSCLILGFYICRAYALARARAQRKEENKKELKTQKICVNNPIPSPSVGNRPASKDDRSQELMQAAAFSASVCVTIAERTVCITGYKKLLPSTITGGIGLPTEVCFS